MAAPSSSVVRSASVTWKSQLLPTMHDVDTPLPTSAASVGSMSTRPSGLRVEPKATSVAVCRCRSVAARRKNSASRGWPAGSRLDPADAQPVELLGDPQLVLDGQRDALELGPVPQGGVEDVDGRRGGAPSPDMLDPVLVLVDLPAHGPAVLLADGQRHRPGAGMGRSSTEDTDDTSAAVPHTNISSAT